MKLLAIYITNNATAYGERKHSAEPCCSFGSATLSPTRTTRLCGNKAESLWVSETQSSMRMTETVCATKRV